MYDGFSWSKDCMVIRNRADAVLLAHLRAGHTPLLKAYANPSTPDVDNRTLAAEVPRLDATRQNIFGSPSPPFKGLTTNSERVLALIRATLNNNINNNLPHFSCHR